MATSAQVGVGRRGQRFYVVMAIIATAIVFAGFARTFYLNGYFEKLSLPPLVVFHGIVFSSWIVLLIVQTSLVAAKRTPIHRRLGVAGGALVVLMLVVGLATAIHAVRRGFAPPGGPPPHVFLVVPFFDLVVFASLVGAAFYFRQRPETHKRLMLVATIAILPPATVRILIALNSPAIVPLGFGLAVLVLLVCIARDLLVHRGLHRAYLWGGLLFVCSIPLRFAIGGTAAWLAFAHWLTGT